MVMLNAAQSGIVLTTAGLMSLMGLEPVWAAGIAAYVVKGKVMPGLFKAGH